MNYKQKNTLLAVGIVAGLVSLPMTWLTIHSAEMNVDGDFTVISSPMFLHLPLNITGLNGHVTILFKTPIWLVVGIAIAANVVQLMRSSNAFAIPRFAPWLVAFVAAAWITIPILASTASGRVSLGIGWLLGVFCAAVPLICLFTPDTPARDSPLEPNNGTNSP